MKTLHKSLLIAFAISLFSSFTTKIPVTRTKQDEKPITLSEYNLHIANKNKMVLVYFSADWCAVCIKMKPVLENTGNKFSSTLELLKIDTEHDKEITDEFEIDALPVLILYRNGVREWVYVGVIDETVLAKKIDSYILYK